MKFLRTVSTRRLLALIAALVVVVAGGAAIALAATSGGPVPRRERLARAIRSALTAPAVTGISARVSFTDHLVDSSDVEGSDPILTGATGRLWLSTGSSDHRLRLELQGGNGDGQAVLNDGSFWVYDPSSNTVYRGQLPKPAHHKAEAKKSRSEQLPSLETIQKDIDKLVQHVNLSGAAPGDIAGQPAYTVTVSPKHDGGLLGSAQLAWDAVHGVPLRFAVYASGANAPVLELKVTDISYGAVPASDFDAAPPTGAKVVNVSVPAHRTAGATRHVRRAEKRRIVATGAAAVARKLSFKLHAPRTLAGLRRQSVRLLDWAGSPAALVSYGQNLGGIAVIEQAPKSTQLDTSSGQGDHRHGLNLPTVSIDGSTGQELDTALGTLVRFARSGVTYTVLGSVPPKAAEAAARAL